MRKHETGQDFANAIDELEKRIESIERSERLSIPGEGTEILKPIPFPEDNWANVPSASDDAETYVKMRENPVFESVRFALSWGGGTIIPDERIPMILREIEVHGSNITIRYDRIGAHPDEEQTAQFHVGDRCRDNQGHIYWILRIHDNGFMADVFQEGESLPLVKRLENLTPIPF